VKSRGRLLLFLAGVLLIAFLSWRWRLARIELSQDKNILAASHKHDVDPALIKAIVWRESRFDPWARGSKGETGLMQIMEITGREWAREERVPLYSKLTLMDSAKNIDCGTWYLHKLLRRYQSTDNPVPYALADYNAGRSNALKWMKGAAMTNSDVFLDQIGFASTRSYVGAVMKRREKYMAQFQPR
jgi:soluble lytic murein transglycosylase